MSKKLYKSQNKLIFGVCGGIADYFNMDPTIIRLLMIILLVVSFGTGLIVYIVAAVIMPDRHVDDMNDSDNLKSAGSSSTCQKENESESDDEFNRYFKKK